MQYRSKYSVFHGSWQVFQLGLVVDAKDAPAKAAPAKAAANTSMGSTLATLLQVTIVPPHSPLILSSSFSPKT